MAGLRMAAFRQALLLLSLNAIIGISNTLSLAPVLHDDNCPCHGINCSCGASFPQYCGHNDQCSCIEPNQVCCGADGVYCTNGIEVCSDCPYNSPLPCSKTTAPHFADGCCPANQAGEICSGHGNCTSESGHKCICEFGWGGRSCAENCSKTGHCEARNPHNTWQCNDQNTVASCKSVQDMCQWVCGASCEPRPLYRESVTAFLTLTLVLTLTR